MISELKLVDQNYDICSCYCWRSRRSPRSSSGKRPPAPMGNVKRAPKRPTITAATTARIRSALMPHLSALALLLVATAPLMAVRASADQQLYKLATADEGQLLAAAAEAAASQQAADHNAPGHYEFEMAPRMEPPSVRKPPYIQSALMCPGSDPFAGFSPTDTLCGDLNQGRVPVNPLGQSVAEQSYPFELIKNKTLQFLARALPVLKLEYETIPKVARYLSANHLLNPTHQASPLSSEHMQQLNQRFAISNGLTQEELLSNTAYLQFQQQQQRRRRRRKKRSAAASGAVVSGEHSIGITVAEMSPNATLVFSSAHSSAGGRIGSSPSAAAAHYHQHHHYSPLPAAPKNESSEQALVTSSTATGLALLTKDGHKTIVGAPPATKPQRFQQQQPAAGSTKHAQNHYAWAQSQLGLQTQQQQQQKTSAQSSATSSDNSASKKLGGQQQPSGALNALAAVAAAASASARNNGDSKQTGASAAAPSAAAGGASKHRQQAPGAPANLLNSAAATGQQHNHVTPAGEAGEESRDEQQQQQQPGSSDSAAAAGAAFGQGRSSGESSPVPSNSPSPSTSGSASNASGSQQPAVSATPSRRRAFSCSESGGGFTAAVCQAASALIEGDRPPAWLQIVKHLGNAYSGASADNMASSSSGSPIWSILSSLAQEPSISRGSSGGIGSSLSASSAQSKTANLLGMLGPLTSFLSGTSAKDSASGQDYSSPQNKEHPAPQTLASALSTIGSSTMTRLALAGWASNAIASLVDYFVPSAARTFAKRKKPFDPQETFVDTPASLVAAMSGKSASAPANGFASAKQPPTPCPSVEEYISPTFARNYQGAWKYVVQIPHEGYFTQTIQRTSCVRQKCEFTEGVCHESPRWVSLLVAEIYYPNTIFGGTASNQLLPEQQQQLQQQVAGNSVRNQMATSSSTNNIHQVALQQAQQQQRQLSANGKSLPSQVGVQDPLQMTDSLNTYNHNLNAAFINAANELGLDPNNVANMQQLANAYNYQLMQRNGLLSVQQQQQQQQQLQAQPQVAESRSSQQQQHSYVSHGLQAPANQPISPGDQYAQIEAALLAANTNQQQQLQLQQQGTLSQSDYITALAAAALQQNPNLNINDLINSLQRRRKKRDISALGGGQYSQQYNAGVVPRRPTHHHYQQQQQPQQFANSNNNQPIIQQRSSVSSSNLESMPSMNDINTHLPQQLLAANNVGSQQQQLYKQPVSSQSQSDSLVSVPGSGSAPMSQQQGPQQQQQQTAPSGGDMNPQQQAGADGANQVECDGHDKIGCYVVRVYYDWFLVNGSCKCWKTTNGPQQAGGSSASGNSFLRRIFTG